MERRVIGPAQIRAHRYARRRMDLALTAGTTLPATDPGRLSRRCTVASFGLAVALLAAAGVMAAVRPAPDWSGAAVLVDTGTGTAYLHRAGVLHPSLNLTSALLAADTPDLPTPVRVSTADIEDAPRGPLIGIPGAPAELPRRDRLVTGGWTVCDQAGPDGSTSTVVVGMPAPGTALPTTTAAVVVTDDGGGPAEYLLWAGRRIPVDLADRALADALGITGTVPRPMDGALAGVLPTVAAPVVSVPEGAGLSATVEIVGPAGDPIPVGTVLRTQHADGRTTLHLLHRDGIEALTPVVADLTAARIGSRVVTVEGHQVAALPQTREAPTMTTALPPTAPRLLTDRTSVLCASWQGPSGGWSVSTGGVLDAPGVPAPEGRVDRVQLPPGVGAVVRVGPAVADAAPVDYLVAGAMAYPLGPDVASRLGLLDHGATPPEAPAAVVELLPPGPALTVEAATAPWTLGTSTTGGPTPTDASRPPSTAPLGGP